MNKQFISGIFILTLFLSYSCNSNRQGKNEEPAYSDTVLAEKPASAPITVSAKEMCSDFTGNSGLALTKYKDNVLILSGTVHLAKSLSEDDCNYLTMMCSDNNSPTDTTPLLIKCCILDIKRIDTLKTGDMVSLHCRLRDFSNNIVLLDEIAQ